MNGLFDQSSQYPLAVGLFVLVQLAVVVLAAVLFRRRRLRAADAQPGNGKKQKRKDERHPVAVVVAALAVAACTAYSGDTSWRFAEEHLGMHSLRERGFLFFAGELALFGCALMARSNMPVAARSA
ncbi:hypothetical protein [Streptomyces sp. NPDC001070]